MNKRWYFAAYFVLSFTLVSEVEAQRWKVFLDTARSIRAEQKAAGVYTRGAWRSEMPEAYKVAYGNRLARRALSAGPNQWVSTGFSPAGDVWYQRGLSDNYAVGIDGMDEARRLFRFVPETDMRYAVAFEELSVSGRMMRTCNAIYCAPFAIRGRTRSASFLPGRAGAEVVLPVGNSIKSVTHVGVFLRGNADYSDFRTILRAADEFGVREGSRGERFVTGIRDVIENRAKWGPVDPMFRARPVENVSELELLMREVAKPFRIPGDLYERGRNRVRGF